MPSEELSIIFTEVQFYYTKGTERSPMDNENYNAWGFPCSAYCCLPPASSSPCKQTQSTNQTTAV